MELVEVLEKPDQRLRAERSSKWSGRCMNFMVSAYPYYQPALLLTNPRLFTLFPQAPTYKHINEHRKVLESVKSLLPSTSISAFDEWKDTRLIDHVRLVKSQEMGMEEANALIELLPIIPPLVEVTS
jgi:hypothetical protein